MDNMKTKQFIKSLASLVVTTTLFTGVNHIVAPAMAQDRPDPEQFRQMMMDRFREQLDVKGDDEWKLIQDRIQKVMDARMAGGGFGFPGMGRPPGGGPSGPGGGPGGPGGGPGGPGGGPGRMGQRSPEAQALQAALEAKASPDEVKAKLAQLREARKANEAKLAQAQEELQKILSVRQEAAAVLAGLLK